VEGREAANYRKPKGYYYGSIEHLLSDAGKFFNPAPLTAGEKGYVNQCIDLLRFVPQKKQCYYNSQMMLLVDADDRLEYCEGYAVSIMPLLHGWITINGKVVDLTWTCDEGKYILGKFGRDRAYMGLTISREDVIKMQVQKGAAQCHIDNWEDRFPLLKTKFKNG